MNQNHSAHGKEEVWLLVVSTRIQRTKKQPIAFSPDPFCCVVCTGDFNVQIGSHEQCSDQGAGERSSSQPNAKSVVRAGFSHCTKGLEKSLCDFTGTIFVR